MSYEPRPNASGDTLLGSRDQIRTNFEVIDTVNTVNHIAFGGSGQGKHKFMQMPVQSSAPTTASNESALYTKTSGSRRELYFRSKSDGSEYQITRVLDGSFTEFATNTAYAANHTGGWSFLPGGLIIQYGLFTLPVAANTGTITFPMAFPSGSAPFMVTATPLRTTGRPVSVDSATIPTSTEFIFRLDSTGSVGVYWYAIGN